ncbi:MAG TPA: VTT domain-containing protein [Solirubrobacteraceae bacterium]|nr:VTT domain-containing protein [Solirubrobacteraceae bacterium]
MTGHEISHLLHEYGLGIVFVATALQAVGAPIPGTTVLIAAALYAAASHGLPIAGVIAAGALGALVGTSAGFALGRWRGEWVIGHAGRLLRQSPERVAFMRREFAAHGGWLLFYSRFVTGLRNVIGLLAGASGMSVRRFLPVTAAAATAWALINGLEYFWFGDAVAGASTWLQIVLIVVGLAWLVVSFRLLRRHTLRRWRESEGAGLPEPAAQDLGPP